MLFIPFICALLTCTSPPVDRPNIVLVLADDLGVGDLGACNEHSLIPTPHIDRIAQAGLRCTDAHSASAVCTPSRYALLTGEYAWRTHMKEWVLGAESPALIPLGTPTLGSMLQDAGYTTLGVGKWHLGLGDDNPVDWSKPLTHGPCDLGFTHWQGIPASLDMAPVVWLIDRGVEAEPTDEIKGSAHRRQGGEGFWRGGSIGPGIAHADMLPRTIDTACGWIEQYASSDAPFFLYVPLSAPHTPWLPSDSGKGVSTAGWYGDFVVDVDRGIGRIDQALRDAGMADNTIVIVTSDNGAHWPESDVETFGHLANAGWRGQKADVHEGGHRVPLIIRWPGHMPAGGVTDIPISLIDLMPTLATLLQLPLPKGASPDGEAVDLLAPSWEDRPIVHHSGVGMFALRLGRWKLIEGLGSGGFTKPRHVEPTDGGPRVQLYDLALDPSETRNVALGHPNVVARLQATLDAIRGDATSDND
jgi:arylsulfatase A